MLKKPLTIPNEQAMIELAKKIAHGLTAPFTIYLSGELGAGKTTLTRAMLAALGVTGTIKSPTYSLIEPYTVQQTKLFHLDLYRLSHPEELDFIGLSDYFAEPAIILIEWPERGGSYLPQPDLLINISIDSTARLLQCIAYSTQAEKLLNSL